MINKCLYWLRNAIFRSNIDVFGPEDDLPIDLVLSEAGRSAIYVASH